MKSRKGLVFIYADYECGLAMKRKRYSVEQIVAAVEQHELGTSVPDICRKLG